MFVQKISASISLTIWKENPAELRQSILRFLGGDPDKPSGGLKPHDNDDAGQRQASADRQKCATVWLNFSNMN